MCIALYLGCFSPSSPKVAKRAIFAARFCNAFSIGGIAEWFWNNRNCYGDIDLRRLVFVCVAQAIGVVCCKTPSVGEVCLKIVPDSVGVGQQQGRSSNSPRLHAFLSTLCSLLSTLHSPLLTLTITERLAQFQARFLATGDSFSARLAGAVSPGKIIRPAIKTNLPSQTSPRPLPSPEKESRRLSSPATTVPDTNGTAACGART